MGHDGFSGRLTAELDCHPSYIVLGALSFKFAKARSRSTDSESSARGGQVLLPRLFQLIVAQTDCAQECVPARVVVEVRSEPIFAHFGHTGVALPARVPATRKPDRAHSDMRRSRQPETLPFRQIFVSFQPEPHLPRGFVSDPSARTPQRSVKSKDLTFDQWLESTHRAAACAGPATATEKRLWLGLDDRACISWWQLRIQDRRSEKRF